MLRVTFAMAAWLICSPIFGQIRVDTELKIVGPTAPVQVREIEQLQINGLDASKLKLTRLVSYPRDGVRLIAAQSWQGEPLLLFSSKVPGKVLIAIVPPPEKPDTIAPYAEIEITVEGDGPKPNPDPNPGPDPKPEPSVNPYPPPSAALTTAVTPVSKVKMSRTDATALATMYAQVKPRIAAGTIKTSTELRQYLVDAGTALAIKGKYAGLSDAVEKFLTDNLGLSVRPVEPKDTECLMALAWAVWEAGK